MTNYHAVRIRRQRVLALLLRAKSHGVLTKDIARAMGLPQSTARQYLLDLYAAGFVRRDRVPNPGKGCILHVRWFAIDVAGRDGEAVPELLTP